MEQKFCVFCMQPSAEDICINCGKRNKLYQPASHHLQPGTILNNKYLIGAVLGEGGFGITYIGRDINLDMRVAIKEYYPSGMVNRNNTCSEELTVNVGDAQEVFEKGKNSFLTEARILAKFSNESSIVYVRDFFSANNTAYIVMDYLEGIDLKEYLIQNGKMSFEQAYSMLSPIMNGLNKIHGQGLIHRDISPANIMILKDGSVKLLDFGAARDISSGDEKSLSIMLKPGFAPEEQYRSKGHQGPWTDVYALSATMYKMLTGETPEDAMNRLFTDDIRQITELNRTVKPAQEAVILKGMAIQKENRYQTVADLQAACETCVLPNNSNLVDDEKTIGFFPEDVYGEEQKETDRNDDDTDSPIPDSGLQIKEVIDVKADIKAKRRLKKRFIMILSGMVAVVMAMFVGNLTFLSLNTINIGDTKIKRDETCVNLSADIINNNDIAKLKELKNLEELYITACFLDDEDIKVIGELKNLKKLSVTGNTDITDVSSLNNLTGLIYLDISKTGTKDISCLDKLAELNKLYIDNTKVSDLSVLKMYTNLEDLRMDSMSELDPETISIPNSLKYISCKSDRIDNLEFIANAETIWIIYASDNNISDLTPLANCNELYQVEFVSNQITDISPIAKESLWEINVTDNQIADISSLRKCNQLSTLRLGNNQIVDISALAGHSELGIVEMNDNQITDISALKDCFNITHLDISHNQISDVMPLATVDDIYMLTANDNQIEDISALSQCQNLKASAYGLNLSNNKIRDLTALSEFQTRALYLDNNEITDITPLSSCSNLEIVNLNHNQITDITPLFEVPSLHTLQVADNPITELDEVTLNPDGALLGNAVFAISYNETINWEKLAGAERLEVRIYDVDERQKDRLRELGFYEFRSLEDLDAKDAESMEDEEGE